LAAIARDNLFASTFVGGMIGGATIGRYLMKIAHEFGGVNPTHPEIPGSFPG
jgi:predicted lipid-binding transport protein (Tim44 family)